MRRLTTFRAEYIHAAAVNRITNMYILVVFFLRWPFKYAVSIETIYSVNNRMIKECGAVGGMRIDGRSRSTRRKLALVPLSPPQIPDEMGFNPGLRADGLVRTRTG
jgi:hypothetical protein